MRRPLLALPLVALIASAWFFAFGAGLESDLLIGGIQVNEADHEHWVGTLDEAGFNAVQVTVYAMQGDWDSANLWWEEEEPWVLSEIRAAHERGLRTVLVLRVALDHAFERNRFFWHGMIMPASPAELREWFDRYERFVVKWARIAQEEGVEVLAIASEMNSLTNTLPVEELPVLEEYWTSDEKVVRERQRVLEYREEIEQRHLRVRGFDNYDELEPFLEDRDGAHTSWARAVSFLDEPDSVRRINERRGTLESRWERIVERARAVYDGRLTYAANFDQYFEVGWWGHLDLMSINAYFPLLESPPPERADRLPMFRAGWTRILSEIDAFRVGHGIPGQRILFTEIGYVSRRNATVQPWAASGFSVLHAAGGPELVVWEDQPQDRRERALAVRALYEAHLDLGGELLAGILYWKLSTLPEHSEVEPFVLIVGTGETDPLLEELVRFRTDLRLDRLRRSIWGPPFRRRG